MAIGKGEPPGKIAACQAGKHVANSGAPLRAATMPGEPGGECDVRHAAAHSSFRTASAYYGGMWQQKVIRLAPRARGFHLVTAEILQQLPELAGYRCGLLHLFIQHTSASLTINENADPSVRHDMEAHLHRMVPELAPYFRHTLEGPDDMPAHIKASLLGAALTLPVQNGRPALGTWQGIWLGEHREHGGARQIVATLSGELKDD